MMCPCTITSSPARSFRISAGSVIGKVSSCVATQNSLSNSTVPSAAMCAEARRAAQHW